MAEGSKIELQISATGGAQAAADVAQVTREIEAQGEAVMGQADAAEQAGPKLDRLVGIERAQVVQQLSQVFGQLGGKIREVGNTLRDVDSETASALVNMATGFDTLSSAMSGAAMGFAVGGPLGAVAGGTAAMATGVISAAVEMYEAFKKVELAELRAADAALKLREAQSMAGERVYGDDLKKRYDAEALAIDLLIEKTARLEKLRGGKEAADAAEREAADAEAVRSGVDPEIVKKRRAVDDAARAKTSIERDLQDKNDLETARRLAAEEAVADRDRMAASPGAFQMDIDAAAKRAADAQEAASKAQEARVLAEQLAPDKRRAIDAKAGATVAALDEQQRNRIIAEEKQARAEQQRVQDDFDRQQERAAAEQGKDNKSAAKAGRDAEKLLPEGLKKSFRDAVTRVARGLQDGDQGGELKELLDLMNQLAAATVKHRVKLTGDIAELRSQIKNLRSGK